MAGRLSGLCGRGESERQSMLLLGPPPLVKRRVGEFAPAEWAPLLVAIERLLLSLPPPRVLAAPRTKSLMSPLYISESAWSDSRRVRL